MASSHQEFPDSGRSTEHPPDLSDLAAPSRPLSWLPAAVYAAVLVGGLYGAAVADSGIRWASTVGFALCVALLPLVDHVERRCCRTGPRLGPAAALMAIRLGLFAVALALNESGVARALFVLVPYTAFLAFGRRTSVQLSVGCVILVLAADALWVPGWYRQPDRIGDLLMSGLVLGLTIATTAIALAEQNARLGLHEALGELRRSHEQLTDYAARVAQLSAESERNRLARDFHDGLGHHLTAIAVQLEKASAFHALDARASQEAIAAARRSATLALDEVRVSVRALRGDGETEPVAMSAALAELVRTLGGGSLPVTLDARGDEHRYPAEVLTTLYRAAQEGLTNAHRHAHATRVAMSIEYGEDAARLVIADDGAGFAADTRRGGFGLRAMRERLELLGGTLDIATTVGEGTTITARVPRTMPTTAPTNGTFR